MTLSKSISLRTLSELQEDEAVIDLTDSNTVLQFANSIRNLGSTRRQTIWVQNVQTNDGVQSETMTHEQMDDILLFLIIIYAKEQYPDEDDELISKLKEFVSTSPFNNLQKYIEHKYFPLIEAEFVNNNCYFASMIEDYAHNELITNYTRNISHFGRTLSRTSTPSTLTLNIEDILCCKFEEKIMDLFAQRLSKIEYRLDTISKEVQLMKYAMIEDAKQQNDGDIMDDKRDGLMDNIIKEMTNMKEEMAKIALKQNERLCKKKSKKRLKLRRRSTDVNINVNIGSLINDGNKGKKALKEWLKDECGLSQYENIFIQNGLDNLSVLTHITITDLAFLGIQTLGHRVKIMQKIQKLKYEMRITN